MKMRWKRLVTEQKTPSDVDQIMASFNNDVSDQKFSPTREFLETAYGILNREFFHDSLPKRLHFMVRTQPTKSYIGLASYIWNDRTGSVSATSVTLNSSRTLTLHEWLEVVLHEMIHVLDYETNPHHFTGYMRRSYDAHGYWFLTEGEKYNKYGFHVQKYCNADIGINTSDERVRSRLTNSVFLYMKGTSNQKPLIMKMSRKGMEKNLDFIMMRIDQGSQFGIGVDEIKVMTSDNPKIAMLKDLRMRDETSRIFWWWYDDKFEEKYGPFKEERTIKLMKPAWNKINEDDDEGEKKPENQDSEETIEQIEDNIKGVEEVKEIGDEKFLVSIP